MESNSPIQNYLTSKDYSSALILETVSDNESIYDSTSEPAPKDKNEVLQSPHFRSSL